MIGSRAFAAGISCRLLQLHLLKGAPLGQMDARSNSSSDSDDFLGRPSGARLHAPLGDPPGAPEGAPPAAARPEPRGGALRRALADALHPLRPPRADSPAGHAPLLDHGDDPQDDHSDGTPSYTPTSPGDEAKVDEPEADKEEVDEQEVDHTKLVPVDPGVDAQDAQDALGVGPAPTAAGQESDDSADFLGAVAGQQCPEPWQSDGRLSVHSYMSAMVPVRGAPTAAGHESDDSADFLGAVSKGKGASPVSSDDADFLGPVAPAQSPSPQAASSSAIVPAEPTEDLQPRRKKSRWEICAEARGCKARLATRDVKQKAGRLAVEAFNKAKGQSVRSTGVRKVELTVASGRRKDFQLGLVVRNRLL